MSGQRPDPATLTETHWDLIVVGGGITGAGILHQASQQGLSTLLVEQRDFAWGTSSRSSKMVHGGLRYLSQGDFRLTRRALVERERLIRELPELVIRQDYLFPVRKGVFPGRWALKGVLWLYDFLAGIHDHRWLNQSELLNTAPGLRQDRLRGAMSYTDALTDDTRLVMRVLHDALANGGRACNYLRVMNIEREDGSFTVSVDDQVEAGRSLQFKAGKVINATGAWADKLSMSDSRVRPQRGSHLFVPSARLPVNQCFTLLNPDDHRPVFVYPWEGTTCIGTTDIDHHDTLDFEPFCSAVEIDYLLALVNKEFPNVNISRTDIISTMAGVRPIIASGKGLHPSAERRDHAVWESGGVITVSGGKLTTFRLIALDALRAAGLIDKATHQAEIKSKKACFNPGVSTYGTLGHPLAAMPEGEELAATIRWVLNNEQVVHLDDLMLRRTRLGNLLPKGGAEVMETVCQCCRSVLGWDARRWAEELLRYQDIISRFYAVREA